jgi:RNA polymerase sigma-70 factor (ECF subfamily)
MELGVGLEEASVERRTDFDPFFHANFPKVARAAAFVARDAGVGQELAQEAFIRLLQRWGDMRSDDHARNFVFKVAINLARSHLRKHGRVTLYGLRTPEEPGRSDVGGADRAEMLEALGALTPRQRACVVLVDYVDMAPEHVGRVLGMATATVRVHLMRGRAELRERLGLAGQEER